MHKVNYSKINYYITSNNSNNQFFILLSTKNKHLVLHININNYSNPSCNNNKLAYLGNNRQFNSSSNQNSNNNKHYLDKLRSISHNKLFNKIIIMFLPILNRYFIIHNPAPT